MGPADVVDPPVGARIVDGGGRTLLPGLIDAHVHLSKARAPALPLLVAHGVTTVRDMGGDTEELLRWRREIGGGDRVGPRILLAGPYLEAPSNVERMRSTPVTEMVEPVERTRVPVADPEEARRVVDSVAALGVDHLKIRTVADAETYRALNRAAEEAGLPLVGHVFGIPPGMVLEAGQEGVEHFFFPVLDEVAEAERRAHWRAMAGAGVSVTPTLVTFDRSAFASPEALAAILSDSTGAVDPLRPYLSRYLLLDWREQAAEADDELRALLEGIHPSVLRDLREMHEEGVDLLPGSDLAVVNIFPGRGLHEELALLVEDVGMTPAEAIHAATGRAARVLGLEGVTGRIIPGASADLLLVEGDPLADIRRTRQIEAVVLRGRLWQGDEIDGLLEEARRMPAIHENDWIREPVPAGSFELEISAGGATIPGRLDIVPCGGGSA